MKNFLAALRFASFVIMTLGLYSIWFVLSFVIPNKILWRQIIFGAWAHGFLKIAGITVDTIGTPPKPPFFLVSNHLTYMDIPLLRSVAKGVFVAKGEIESWFLAGRICADMGVIYINRQNRRDIPRAGEEILKRLDDGEGVIVFPEGTSSKGEEVLKFNSSFLQFAAQSNLPVHYAAIRYETPAGGPTATEVVAWWEDISFAAQMWRMFKIPSIRATVVFGDSPVQMSDRKELAKTLWEKVSEKFIPLS